MSIHGNAGIPLIILTLCMKEPKKLTRSYFFDQGTSGYSGRGLEQKENRTHMSITLPFIYIVRNVQYFVQHTARRVFLIIFLAINGTLSVNSFYTVSTVEQYNIKV